MSFYRLASKSLRPQEKALPRVDWNSLFDLDWFFFSHCDRFLWLVRIFRDLERVAAAEDLEIRRSRRVPARVSPWNGRPDSR